jgi:hypothetical protein
MAEVIRKFLEHPDLDNNTLEEVPDYLNETSKLLGMMATELYRRREIGEWKPLED